MEADQDAYGQEVWDYFRGRTDIQEIIEREDGRIDISGGPAAYFAPFAAWPAVEQAAVATVRGRVLDVGCGPGRVALHLQAQGCEVVGIDNSPLAVAVARERGVTDARVMSITQVSRQALGLFDAIVMFGNNFGLMANRRRARWLLRRFAGMTTPDGRILAESLNPYDTDNPHHLAYQEQNRQRGRMGGQVRIRVRYQRSKGPWFDYLLVSPAEMAELAAGAGWRLASVRQKPPDPFYIGLLKKEPGEGG